MRRVLTGIAALQVIVVLHLTAAFAQAAQLQVRVRDSRTGVAVGGAVVRSGPSTSPTGRLGAVVVEDAAGAVDLEVRAARYRPLTTRLTADAAAPETTVWLDPDSLPAEMEPASIAARSRAGMLLVHGHVVDAETALPIEGAAVRMAAGGATARSDGRGYFWFLTTAGGAEPTELASGDVLASKEGYGAWVLKGLLLHEGDVHVIVELPRGDETAVHDASHGLAAVASPTAGRTPAPGEQAFGGLVEVSSSSFTVPETIRVGFDCTKATTCTRVGVYSLETYVANGLDDEWIASWPAESLKAGAVAYRSYAAWHVLHPRTSTYDICSTTSCQVNKPETTTSSVLNAAAVTRGVLAVNAAGTEPFFAEYSAHNNNLCATSTCSGGGYTWTSCGDGFCGRPPEWPCLADSVEAGYTLAGHGGGMSQWGSYRWNLQGKDWRWIVDHYYNDNGHPSGSRSAPMNAAVTVLAKNGADDWQGPVAFTVGSMSGAAVPFTMSGGAAAYSVAWMGGGPAASTFIRVTPSATQDVASGDSATFTLEFGPACTSFSTSIGSLNTGAGAGSIRVTISGSPADCSGGSWSAASQSPWLTVSPSSGTGGGTVTLSWTANADAPRSGTAAIAGNTVMVIQLGEKAGGRRRAAGRR